MLAALILWTIVSFGGCVVCAVKFLVKRVKVNGKATVLSLENKYEDKNSAGRIEKITYKYSVQIHSADDSNITSHLYEEVKGAKKTKFKIGDCIPVNYDAKADFTETYLDEKANFVHSAIVFAVSLLATIGFGIITFAVL